MLISCPECGKSISDQSDKCIYCGYPLSKMPKIQLSNKQCPVCNGNKHILNGIEDTCGICGYIYNQAECKKINPNYRPYANIQSNQPKCPTCQSTNIQKIGGMERGMSVATLGIFSKKINKTFKCNNCGYMW